MVVAAAAALFVPVSYDVSAPARLEGYVQRIVAAPIDGFLEQVNVASRRQSPRGRRDRGTVPAELQSERAKRLSELAQQENLYGAALARADRMQLVIYQAKAAEAQAQLALVSNHIERARIRAPFDGVVIKGDLSQSLGAPVQRGEVLMTLAPDERFRLIIEVDERDVAQLQPGLPGRLAIAVTPGETLGFRVSHILPVAVAGDGRNYFEVEALFDTPNKVLRPGMRGVAKIAAASTPCCGSSRIAWSTGCVSRPGRWGINGRIAVQPALASRERPAPAAARRRAGAAAGLPRRAMVSPDRRASGRQHRINRSAYELIGRFDGRTSSTGCGRCCSTDSATRRRRRTRWCACSRG